MKVIRNTLLLALGALLLVASFGSGRTVTAQGQEVWPNTGNGWIEFDNLSGFVFTYTAPDGYLVAESCYKTATEVVYKTYDPPQKSIVITTRASVGTDPGGYDPPQKSIVITTRHEISRVSVRIVPEPIPTPTATQEITDTPEPTPTATQEITDTPEPTPTGTLVITNTPNPTATPGDVITEVNTGSGISIPFFLILGGLAVIVMITCGTFRKQKIG